MQQKNLKKKLKLLTWTTIDFGLSLGGRNTVVNSVYGPGRNVGVTENGERGTGKWSGLIRKISKRSRV